MDPYLGQFPNILRNIERISDIYDISNPLESVKIDLSNLSVDAGRWTPRESTIYINKFIVDLFPQHLEDILYHEIGHVFSHKIWGLNGRGHGKPWQEIMIMMGQSTEISFPYHFMNTFKCNTCKTTHPFSKEIFDRLRMGCLFQCAICTNILWVTQEMLLKSLSF